MFPRSDFDLWKTQKLQRGINVEVENDFDILAIHKSAFSNSVPKRVIIQVKETVVIGSTELLCVFMALLSDIDGLFIN